MPSTRLKKETTLLLAGLSPSTRRTTRSSSSLTRFAYHNASTTTAIPDIEDGAGAATIASSRKRRRIVKVEVNAVNGHDESPKDVLLASTSTSTSTKTNTKIETSSSEAQPRKRRKPARVIKGSSPSSKTVEPPSDWQQMYDLVREMRLSGPARDAAVDTMGCDRLFAPDASERDRRFHILVALMMSSQTKDTVNAVAMSKLHNELPAYEAGKPPGLNLENVLAVAPEKLNELIRVVGFHNNKTKYIKQAAQILRDSHNSDIPSTIEGLTSLPGVGPKMAHLCLSAAWGRTEGIGVDVHVHRLTNFWGWHATSNPEASRLALESWLPRDKWHEINTLLVGFGQTLCPPQAGQRRCGECTLGLEGLCRGADRRKVMEGRKRSTKKEESETSVKDEEVEVEAEEESKYFMSRKIKVEETTDL